VNTKLENTLKNVIVG